MYTMVLFVLSDITYCHDILNAWEDAGIIGVTMLDSYGLGHVRNAVRDDIPLIPSISEIFKKSEAKHQTFFTVVENDEQIDAIIAATESVIGSLEEPDTGFLFTVPVGRVYGSSTKKK